MEKGQVKCLVSGMGAGISKTSDELKLNKPLSNFLYLNQKKAKKPKYLAKSFLYKNKTS